MVTNFFKQLSTLTNKGIWVFTIEQQQPEFYVVSVIFKDMDGKDKAKNVIAPLILRGSPADFDQYFIGNIQKPIKQTIELYTGLANYTKQIEQAQKESKMEKDKSVKAAKEKPGKESKYHVAMKKAEDLEAAGKFREAWTALPDPAEYPDHANTIRQRRTEISEQFAPTIF